MVQRTATSFDVKIPCLEIKEKSAKRPVSSRPYRQKTRETGSLASDHQWQLWGRQFANVVNSDMVVNRLYSRPLFKRFKWNVSVNCPTFILANWFKGGFIIANGINANVRQAIPN
jgi:hypothetical protein